MKNFSFSIDQKSFITLLEDIAQTGVGSDGKIDKADTKALNTCIATNYENRWAELHGDDEENEDGNKNKTFKKVGKWLTLLLKNDL